MCGIVGFNFEDKDLVRCMADKIAHRGPDAHGYYTDKDISLGHRRLSIIDLSDRGKQPMESHDGRCVIVYNGEVYNYKAIRLELEKKGYTFRSGTDTEVIVNAYQEYGADCVKMLNGIFAFAIWDTQTKKLFLARDRMGIKPLYYHFSDGKLLFASEIKALLEYDIPRVVDTDAFATFMNFRFVTGHKTMIEGIHKLLPGCTLTFDAGNKDIEIKKYWDVTENVQKGSANHFARKLRKLLSESVEMRLMSDVPLGVYLSGGIDSSAIVGLMKKVTDNIKTFSVGFGDEVDNEYSQAQLVADHFGTDHHQVSVTEKHLKLLPKMVYHMDEPIGDAATLPTYVISEFAKKKVTVVLAGEGADEQFAGYDRYKMMLYGHRLSQLTPSFMKQRFLNAKFANTNLERLRDLVCSSELGEKYMKAISLFDKKNLSGLGVAENDYVRKVVDEKFVNNRMKRMLNKVLYFDQKTLLPDDFFMKADKMTMAHSVEERVPFLDHRIVEFSFTLPPRYKMYGLKEKYILKKAMKGLLPEVIIKRKKRGYNTPMDHWLKGELKGQMEELLAEKNHKLYDQTKMSSMLTSFQKSGKDYKKNWFKSQQLWSMLMFEMWYKQFIAEART
ncbi:asparagine synthase (glutamine-hydrolyzing) [Candidatus Woesearchaeota archaeon]|nr:asparagine synthase (glutamine-hydrolyzing) [Candidatus Woesearchaeota archaeon]